MRFPRLSRAVAWTVGIAAGLAALLVTASVLHPQLTANLVAHATPSISLFHNFLAANTHGDGGSAVGAVASLATAAGVIVPRGLAHVQADIKKLTGEIDALMKDNAGKPMPTTIADQIDAKAEEVLVLQREEKTLERVSGIKKYVAGMPNALVPDDDTKSGDEDEAEIKAERKHDREHGIVGYISVGDLVTASKALAEFRGSMKRHDKNTVLLKDGIKSLETRHRFVGLNRAQLTQIKNALAAVETKDAPTIEDLVIQPQRLPEMIRVTEHDRLTMRDILNVSRTSSNLVEFVRLTNYVRAAAAVAMAAEKPEASIEMDTIREAVRTIAVWMPVNNQQIDDVPQLADLINNEMLFDVQKRVEELVVYGDGVGENFLGIVNTPGVLDIGEMPDGSDRGEVGDTYIDKVRRGITDVLTAGYEPNAALMHPFEWEKILLEKGSDNRYVWIVVTENNVQRLWGIKVVETVAMQDFQGVTTEQRHIIVGDFLRGATLFDRQDAAISLGWIDRQFVKNQRTILAEARLAFALKRPGAFRKLLTQEASES